MFGLPHSNQVHFQGHWSRNCGKGRKPLSPLQRWFVFMWRLLVTNCWKTNWWPNSVIHQVLKSFDFFVDHSHESEVLNASACEIIATRSTSYLTILVKIQFIRQHCVISRLLGIDCKPCSRGPFFLLLPDVLRWVLYIPNHFKFSSWGIVQDFGRTSYPGTRPKSTSDFSYFQKLLYPGSWNSENCINWS